MTDDRTILTIAVLGGTGKEGSGLAVRWAASGYNVIIGSRSAERGQQKAAELNALLGGDYLKGMGNVEAAEQANLIVLSVPYAAHAATLESVRTAVQGKILVDVTVPLKEGKVREVHPPEGLSAALEAQAMLGDEVRVVAAFQNISAEHLADPAHTVACDVLVCGNDKAAKAEVLKLVEAARMRGFDAGALRNAIAVESLTPLLIQLNIRYKGKGAGIRITGLEP
ncbi:MAG: NADPH-dependent F420 reductase [Anaerolineae bacterium]|nr:NADPH-dependent F420 reductase [Anaerolineae bacterium]